MIEVRNLVKDYGGHLAVDHLSFTIDDGQIYGFLGPNGAGKTTLFRMIIGEEQPDEGQVAIDRGVSIGYFSQDVGEMAGRPDRL